MRRTAFILITLVLVLMIMAGSAQAQLGFKKGLKLGYNWAKLAGDGQDDAGYRKAFTFGGTFQFNVLGFFALQTDILYSPRGATYPGMDDVKLNYLSIPILFKRIFFPVGIHPYLVFGPEINFLLSAKAGDVDIKDDIKSQAWTVVAGGGLEFSLIGKGVFIEGRYCYGLNNILKDGTGDSVTLRVAQIYVGVLF